MRFLRRLSCARLDIGACELNVNSFWLGLLFRVGRSYHLSQTLFISFFVPSFYWGIIHLTSLNWTYRVHIEIEDVLSARLGGMTHSLTPPTQRNRPACTHFCFVYSFSLRDIYTFLRRFRCEPRERTDLATSGRKCVKRGDLKGNTPTFHLFFPSPKYFHCNSISLFLIRESCHPLLRHRFTLVHQNFTNR